MELVNDENELKKAKKEKIADIISSSVDAVISEMLKEKKIEKSDIFVIDSTKTNVVILLKVKKNVICLKLSVKVEEWTDKISNLIDVLNDESKNIDEISDYIEQNKFVIDKIKAKSQFSIEIDEKSYEMNIFAKDLESFSEKLKFSEYCFFDVRFSRFTERIGKEAFLRCNYLQNVYLNNNLKEIGKKAFFACSELCRCEIPETIEEFGDHAFGSCYKFWAELKLPFIKIVPKNCFSACRELESVEFSDKIEVIDNEAFAGCSSLKTLILPTTNLTRIGRYAFDSCISIKRPALPESVEIGAAAFRKF